VWRWLGREARYRDDAATVAQASRAGAQPTLAPLADFVGRDVRNGHQTIASVVDAMIACEDGQLQGLLVRHGGIGGVGERVVLLAADDYRLRADYIATNLSARDLDRLPEAKETASTAA
jgi:hypothetical protein